MRFDQNRTMTIHMGIIVRPSTNCFCAVLCCAVLCALLVAAGIGFKWLASAAFQWVAAKYHFDFDLGPLEALGSMMMTMNFNRFSY